MVDVSIIIPIYNVAPYIEKCIHSVMKQTRTEGVECIIVDDCGKDNSMEIVERIISEYDGNIEFRILHHDYNRGLSAARNTGIDAARGEYIYFLDSDDWIYHDCIENLLLMANRYPKADFVQGTIHAEDNSLNEWTHGEHNMPFGVDYIDNSSRCRLLLQQTHHLPFMQNRLIKKEFIFNNHLYAKEGIVHEDNLWTFLVGKYIHCIAFCKKDTYFYRKSNGGIMATSDRATRAKCYAIICEYILSDLSLRRKWFNIELSYVLWRLQSIEQLGYKDPFVFFSIRNYTFIKKIYLLTKTQPQIATIHNTLKRSMLIRVYKYCFFISKLLRIV